MARVHCFIDDALGDLDALGVATRIRSGEVSRAEVLEAAIARVRQVNPQLNAVAFEAFERARGQAAAAGPFAGVPTFVKDNTDVAGMPTRHGSAATITARVSKSDGPPAAQFLSAGFVALGKSTMPEFGLTASTEWAGRPPTRNPWDTEYSAGASSGGAAALVASGAVPIAHANDGGGSIRIPAAATGLVGLKPTRCRLLDQPGARALPVNLVAEGVVTRTVRDTAHYLAVAEKFRAAPGLRPVGLVEGPGTRRLRIGVIRDDVRGRRAHPDVDAVVGSAVAVLAAQGHEITETRIQAEPRFIDDFELYWSLFAIVLSATCAARYGSGFDPRRLDPFTKGLAGNLARHPFSLIPAIRRLRGGTAIYERHFTDFDVLLTPTLSHPVPQIGKLATDQPFETVFTALVDYVGFTPLNNIGGGPAIALPHALNSNGLPGSIQLCAPAGGERTLLELAYEFEAARPFPDIRTTTD
ncbi:amidase [Nocardia stercoris]|uniref:amidase n=1 Tax=Nocardia stercoris TaxID=2483361 RepID=A0A3M2LBA4_9NOCA|nr:amidase [Nocardia stercoris]RMI34336.1 amidase [Nocardia stercoris]